MVKSNIAERIRAARKARGWTQAELAEASGLQQPEISKFERGQRRIYADDLQLIAGALGVPASWFMEDNVQIRDAIQAFAQRRPEDAAWLIEAGLAIMRENGG